MINKEALNDLADYIEGGALLTPLNMSNYGDCAVGQYIRREGARSGKYRTTNDITTEAMRSVRDVFGIESGTLEWAFVFGSEWGNDTFHTTLNDRGGAARRLRELATTEKVPTADKWSGFETAGSRSDRVGNRSCMTTLLLAAGAGNLIALLIWLLVLAVVVYVVFLILGMIPMPPQIRTIITIIIALVVLLIIVQQLGFL